MANRFHIAIAAGDLTIALGFYCDILGCSMGNSEDSWADVDFWGNELTLHATDPASYDFKAHLHNVDEEMVVVPHFGVHLNSVDFHLAKQRLQDAGIEYLSPPYTRFEDSDLEQETFFIEDPNHNVIELKTMKMPDALFKDSNNSL